MYAKLKQDMRNANIPVSEGDDLLNSDLQLARDFLYFNGINIGEEFHRYEEVVHGTLAVPAPESDSEESNGDDAEPDEGVVIEDGVELPTADAQEPEVAAEAEEEVIPAEEQAQDPEQEPTAE